MSVLLAHHLELRHLPVVLAIMVAGFWIGLEFASRFTRKKPRN